MFKMPYKQLFLSFLLSFSSVTYADNPIHVTFDLNEATLKNDLVLSFDYATPLSSGPGSVILIKHDSDSEVRLFNADIIGNPLTITKAVVQDGFHSPKSFTINENCKNINLEPMKDKRIYLTFNISTSSKTVSCLLNSYGR